MNRGTPYDVLAFALCIVFKELKEKNMLLSTSGQFSYLAKV
jgi:hypothetical protein